MADRRNPTYREGESFALRARHARAAEGRHTPPPRRGEPRGRARRQAHARGDLALGDTALAAAPRATRRARAARRDHRLHRPDGAPARHPDRAARAVRHPDRLLRRRRADEPAGVRRHGHGLQLVPRRRPVRVRPDRRQLRGRPRPAARARRPPRGDGALGRRPRLLRAVRRREGARRLLLRLRRQVPARVDEGDDRRALARACRTPTSRSAAATSTAMSARRG